MKTTKRWLSVLLCVLMTVMALAVTVAAAGGETNVEFVANKTEVNVDDTFTISFNNKEMTVKGFTAGFTFDKTLVECVSIVGVDPDYPDDYSLISGGGRGGVTYTAPTAISSIEQANNGGTVGYAYAGTKDVTYLENTLFIVTFKAKASGTASFTLYEETNGTDAFASENIDTIVVTIKSATPACEHPNKVSGGCVDNNDGTHTRLTTCRDCGEVVDETIENCTFTDDGDCTTALECEYCLHTKTAAKDAHVAGEDDGDCTTAVKCANCDKIAVEANEKHTGGTATCIAQAKCEVCGTAYGTLADHTFLNNNRGTQLTPGNCITPATYASKCDVCDYEDQAQVITGEKDPTNHAGTEVTYTNNGDTHSATYDCCGAAYVTNAAHDYTTSPDAKTCICGAVKAPDHACVAAQYKDNGDGTHDAYCTCDNTVIDDEPHIYGEKHACQCGAVEPTGWVEIEGAWYYVYEDYTKATGLSRVPYPTVEIMGNTYAPNAADIAYADSKGRDFIDATEAWFLFEDDGKFAYDSMGYVDHGDSQGKLINGMLPWHIGLVEVVEGEYRYFAGDPVNGGNVIATGKIYVSRNTTDLDVVIGGIYFFDENGALVTGDGITDVDGVLYYLEDNRVAIEAGLIEIDGSYYYVRSGGDSAKAGQVVVGRKYYVKNTNGLLAAGMYEFDENGKMVIDPTVNANGIVEIDGVYYYYKAGVKQVGAGVVEMTDELGETFYIYVKSDGTLATGEYWPTTTNGLLERGCYDWGTDGKYYPAN